MYLTYAEYTAAGYSLVTETEFPKYEFIAQSLLDWYTFNRLQDETTISTQIKNLMCALVDMTKERALSLSPGAVVDSTGAITGGAITSQSNDGVSITYNGMNSSDIYQLMGDRCKSIIEQQLYGVVNSAGRKLLYRGLYPGE